MAAGSVDGHQTGSMDIRDHLKTWHGFVKFVKWGLLFNILVLVLLAIFRTH